MNLLAALEKELKVADNASIIVLDSYERFKDVVTTSSSEKLSASQVRKAYALVRKKATELEKNFGKRDPVAHKSLKSLVSDPNVFIVGSSAFADRVLRKEVRTFLESTKSLNSKDKIHGSFTSSASADSPQASVSAFVSRGVLDTSKVNTLKSIQQTIYHKVGPGSKLNATMVHLVESYGTVNLTMLGNAFEKHMKTVVKDIDMDFLGEGTLDHIFDVLRGKKPANKSKTTRRKQAQGPGSVKVRKNATAMVRRKSGRNMSVLTLMNSINRKLPAQIKKNMGSPRLNWRTGRFAHSARVTNISKGHEIRYSYMKNPYAVFEMGALGSARLATPARDPRSIISLSIREIAATMTDQKFRTRRN